MTPNVPGTPSFRARWSQASSCRKLATNAAKYGAWSQDHGRVDIVWQADLDGASLVRMIWRETGGPPILAEPERRGFGSTLLGSTFSEPGAGVDLRWEATGVVGKIRIPVAPHSGDRLEHEPAVRKPPSALPEDHALAGVSVLLAEDEPIVQMELASSLERAGARVVGPVSTLGAAITFAKSEDIDAAVLDVNLNGQSVGAAAEILHARGVPMVFTTGYQSLDSLPPALRHLPRLQKPVSPEDLRARLCKQLRAPVTLTR
jgi:CheY-like chemotaxis protein